MTFCDLPAEIGASLRTDERTNGWTHRRDVRNSFLDLYKVSDGCDFSIYFIAIFEKDVYFVHY